MSEADIARAKRAAARSGWSGVKSRLGQQVALPALPSTASERVALVWRITSDAWALSGKPIPDYARAEAPGVITRKGYAHDDL